jgi:hypothetical protein
VPNDRDPNACTFCGGDPVDGVDSDGRCAQNTPPDVYFGVAPIMETTVTFNDGSFAVTGLPGQAPLMYDSSSVYDSSKSIVTEPTGEYGYYFSSAPLPADYGQYSSTPYTTADPDQQARIQFLADLGIVATTVMTGTEEAAPEFLAPEGEQATLYYYGSEEYVANKTANDMFYGGPGAQGRYWATTDANADTFSLSTGGSVGKDMSSMMTLSPEDAAMFKPAYGFDFSWDPTSWWKGLAGQYYYRPVTTWANRATELGGLGLKTGIAGGVAGGVYYEFGE